MPYREREGGAASAIAMTQAVGETRASVRGVVSCAEPLQVIYRLPARPELRKRAVFRATNVAERSVKLFAKYPAFGNSIGGLQVVNMLSIDSQINTRPRRQGFSGFLACVTKPPPKRTHLQTSHPISRYIPSVI